MCGDEGDPEVTQLYASYPDILRILSTSDTSPSWTEDEMTHLHDRIVQYKVLDKSLF